MKTAKLNPVLYGELLRDALPRVIETEEENERALEIVNNLMKQNENDLSPEESELLSLFVQLIELFEKKAYPMPDIDEKN